MKELEGKVALVTGSSTGLGLAIALELGARGAAVALNYAHRTDRAEKALATFTDSGAKGEMFKDDVTDADSVTPFGITTNQVGFLPTATKTHLRRIWMLTSKRFPQHVGNSRKMWLRRWQIFVRRALPSSPDRHCVLTVDELSPSFLSEHQ